MSLLLFQLPSSPSDRFPNTPHPHQAALRQLGEQLEEGGVLKNEDGEEIIDIREDIKEEYNDDDSGDIIINTTTNDVLLSSSDDEFEDLMQEMEEIELEEEEEEGQERYNKYTDKRQSNGLKRGFLLGSGTNTAGLYEEDSNGAPIDKTTKPPIQSTSMSKHQAFTGQVVERISSSSKGTVPAVPSSSSKQVVSKFKERMGR